MGDPVTCLLLFSAMRFAPIWQMWCNNDGMDQNQEKKNHVRPSSPILRTKGEKVLSAHFQSEAGQTWTTSVQVNEQIFY